GLHAVASLWVVHRDDGIALRTLARPFGPPLPCSLIMATLVVAVNTAGKRFASPHWATLVVGIVVGSATYVLTALRLASDQSQDFLSLLGSALGRRSPSSAGSNVTSHG